MNNTQKSIKYIAIGFALLLAISIITAITETSIAVINVVTNIGGGNTIDYTSRFEDIKSIKIDHLVGRLVVETSDHFEVVASGVDEGFIAIVTNNSTLEVKNKYAPKASFGFNQSMKSDVTIYVPSDFIADSIIIETGASNIILKDLNTKLLTIAAGVGNLTGTDIVADGVHLECGAGNIDFKDVIFRNSTIESGLGSTLIKGELLGPTKVDCGTGEIKLLLNGNSNLYNIRVDHGLGNVTLDGEKLSKQYRNNKTAENTLNISGGLGNIAIDFMN